MSTYTWEFGAEGSGLHFTIVYADGQFTVTSLEGSFDLNALWFSDGNTKSDGYTLPKSDNSLNMNGSTTVWDDGTSSSEKIVWDDYQKLSSTGLGSDGTNKLTFISAGESWTFDASADFDPAVFTTLGVRATSVNGSGSIKWADTEAVETGTNHAPIIDSAAQSGSITETADSAPLADANPTDATGTITFDDVDLSDVPTASILPGASVTGGTAVLSDAQKAALLDNLSLGAVTDNADGSGSVGWTYSVPNSEIDFLGKDETVELTFTVQIDDNNGGTDTQDVVITITGTNDAPTDINLDAVTGLGNNLSVPNGGTLTIASLSSVDPDGDTSFTYSIVSQKVLAGASVTNFLVSGNQLQLNANLSQNTTYELTLRSTDGEGASYDETFRVINGTNSNSNPGDTLNGGNDVPGAYNGDDILFGNNGADIISGLGGNDVLNGQGGNDTLSGGDGNDDLNGGAGNDSLTGGNGSDTFLFELSGEGNFDTIQDFDADPTDGQDLIALLTTAFSSLGATVDSTELRIYDSSTTALASVQDSNDYLIYDTSTGNLYYDANGSTGGGGGLQKIAHFNGSVALDASDFVMQPPPSA